MEKQFAQIPMEHRPGRRLLVRRWVVVAVLLSSIVFPPCAEARRHKPKRYLTKETTVDMKDMKRIYLGWIDMHPDAWAGYGYSSKEEWASVINSLNTAFQGRCGSYMLGRTISGAKEKGDESAGGDDLYIKFSDVGIDYNYYHLYLSIHFIDPKTNSELASIPGRPYYGDAWGFVNYLNAALNEVGVKLQVEIMGGLQEEK